MASDCHSSGSDSARHRPGWHNNVAERESGDVAALRPIAENSHALPSSAERLRSAELIAREIEAWRVNSAGVVRISHELCLPAFKHDPHRPYAWPRQR